jgi:hypothetical protein
MIEHALTTTAFTIDGYKIDKSLGRRTRGGRAIALRVRHDRRRAADD